MVDGDSVREVPGRILRGGHFSVSTVTLHKREKDRYKHQKAGNLSLRRPGNFLASVFLNDTDFTWLPYKTQH